MRRGSAACKHEGCPDLGRVDDGYCPKHHRRVVMWGDSSVLQRPGTRPGFKPVNADNPGVGPERTAAYRRAYLSGTLLAAVNRLLKRSQV